MAHGGGGGGGGRGGGRINVLNVAEKPSVAKSVSEILSRNQQLISRRGRSQFNCIFEFDYVIRGQPCHMLFTSVLGHLMELDFDDRYRKWNSCDPVDLYHATVRKFVPEDKLNIQRTLEEEARKCQWLILWLDCDREGENIAFEVIDVCTKVNRNLDIKRAHFSALIERAIKDSVQNLVMPNKLFADAVDVRQEIDLRIGASFTRFQTMLLSNAFVLDASTNTDGRNLVLSYGPCQFPTLGFVVERYWEREAHEPEDFWTINCTHRSEEGTATFNWMRNHLFDYACALVIYELCVDEPTATVTDVRHQEKLKYPPYPLSTIELEKRASRYLHMSAEHTMKVAEDLYNWGFISYPRTETDRFSLETDLRAMVSEQQGHERWGSYAQRLLDPEAGVWRNPGNGGHDDKAHPPIHPTRFSNGESNWTQQHHKVYELVVRHFLACVSQPAKGAETAVHVDIAGEKFSSTGRVILEKNYLDVYIYESWAGSLIPTYTHGQQFMPTTLTLDSGVTRPPPLLTEADLLTCMDKAGIGTDATMHDHIKKLLDRSYAIKENAYFIPTDLGQALVMGYDDMGYELWKPYLRARMESDMKDVSIGNKRRAEVLDACLQQMKACFIDARARKEKLFEAMGNFFERSNRSSNNDQTSGGVVRKCDLCHNSDMVLKQKPDGNFMVGCLGYPLCRNVVWLPGSISQAVVTGNTCLTCTPGPVFKIQFKFRRLEIPPDYNADHLGCIGGCDDTLKQLIDICGTGARNTSSTPGRGRGNPTSSSSGQRSNSRGRMACIYCRQTGHSSDVCPSHISQSNRRTQGFGQQNGRGQGNSTSSSIGGRINPRNQDFGRQNGEASIPCSSCGSPCTLLTSNSARNPGRKFYSCQACRNFNGWEDMLSGGGSVPRPSGFASNARRGGRANRSGGGHGSSGAFVSATGEPVSGRCFICGDPSHFANVCPNRGR
ncbi:OLC1v1000877C1 [Oldenlandia corymbosa var. corymbosa]|uniref:DNA topoisomerase n=1 Tax=Oldenlandia corymbosa var. corymbosa TaxID=529605 RepID=A0AAV1D4Z8_OLDCO|nr:OLC1v1000877C1 [Oldenlandia corymbosa var. corymbosa]